MIFSLHEVDILDVSNCLLAFFSIEWNPPRKSIFSIGAQRALTIEMQ